MSGSLESSREVATSVCMRFSRLPLRKILFRLASFEESNFERESFFVGCTEAFLP